MKDAKQTPRPAPASGHTDLSSPPRTGRADAVAAAASPAPGAPPSPSPGPTIAAPLGPDTLGADTEAAIGELLQVMAALRDPVTGCPWDKQQTFASIAPYTIEEAYEVADAIERQDMTALKEELGDLLLQVVYHAQIAREENQFAFADVVDAITAKMIRRHPHVFGSDKDRAAGAADGFWERAKDQERAEKSAASAPLDQPRAATNATPASAAGRDAAQSITTPNVTTPSVTAPSVTVLSVTALSVTAPSVLDAVPLPLPALTRAVKLQNKAARVGFDWPSLGPVFAKMKEELGELEEVIAELKAATGDAAKSADVEAAHRRIEEEYGDLLFVIANVARHLKMDPEKALRGTNAKFTRRFQRIEALLALRGKTPIQSDLAEMDALWNEAKREERSDT